MIKDNLLRAAKLDRLSQRNGYLMRNTHAPLLKAFVILALTNSPITLADRWSGKWFEVEVILLSQLEDKAKIREHFDDVIPLPKYRQFYDLLSPYIQPDIASLKQVIVQCNSRIDPLSALKALPDLPPMYEIKSLAQIAKLPVNTTNIDASSTQTSDQANDVDGSDEHIENNGISEQPYNRPTAVIETLQDETLEAVALIKTSPLTNKDDDIQGLTIEQQQWLAAAEQLLNPYPLTYSELTKPFPNAFCVLTNDEFNQLNVNPARFTYNGFLVDEMPRWINGIETVDSEQPYLLSRSSLKLRNIVRQLTRSRNFRPILHLGWRQQAYEINKAVPVRLFAGDNLQAHFVREVEQYFKDKATLEQEESTIANIMGFANEENTEDSFVELQANATAKHINDVLKQLPSITPSNSPIEALAELSINPIKVDNNTSAIVNAPITPAQPWYLDGFFRIHLHQNFLNITADFNIMNLTLAEQATQALQPNAHIETTPIRFEQARRIVSREIHYFDHPYMGMIVQVRRYDQPNTKNESAIEE